MDQDRDEKKKEKENRINLRSQQQYANRSLA
jgi:hypothetical protein